ncbi:hypothetical protein FIBSPDRAFT_870589 [Athelia psychrophila]|uniref:Uncharacterized protein n=1 Tax=Athelia psychrophila TaxID=1759441 RepID=A0A166AYM1_9AGAM|nr:hypothetical protein FIBSPDRAFT_870589 [Fibularhizoctonia sp. CBS 109695]
MSHVSSCYGASVRRDATFIIHINPPVATIPGPSLWWPAADPIQENNKPLRTFSYCSIVSTSDCEELSRALGQHGWMAST